jgi:alpha-1,2-mannosyltransferase
MDKARSLNPAFEHISPGPRLARAALILVIVAGAAKYVRSTILLQIGEVPGDLAVFYVTGLAVRQGIGLYDPEAQRALAVEVIGPERAGRYRAPLDSNTHPPSEVWLPVLVSYLPWPQAADIWRGVLHFSFLAAITWIALDLRRAGASTERVLLAVALAIWLIPVQTSIDFGQLDVPILLLLLLARDLYRRPGGEVWCGVAIGVAACLKPSPVVLLAFFLVRGDWRVIGGAVGAAVVHLVVSSALLGPGAWFDWAFNVLPHLLGGSTNYANHTFNGLSYHLFADPQLLHSLAPPPPLLGARALAQVLNLAALGGAAWLVWKCARRGRDLSFELGYGLFALVMLVTSSLSWEHYYTWVLLPIAALLMPGADWFRGPRDWPWAALGLAAYGLIIATPRFYLLRDMSLYDTYWFLRLFISLKVYGALLLGVLVIRAMRRHGDMESA